MTTATAEPLKEIRIKFGVDEASVARVNMVLDNLIRKSEKLAQTLGGMGKSGGLLSGSVSTGSAGGGAGTAIHVPGSGGGGTQIQIPGSAILDSRGNAFQVLERSAQQAASRIQDSVSRIRTNLQAMNAVGSPAVASLTQALQGLGAQAGQANQGVSAMGWLQNALQTPGGRTVTSMAGLGAKPQNILNLIGGIGGGAGAALGMGGAIAAGWALKQGLTYIETAPRREIDIAARQVFDSSQRVLGGRGGEFRDYNAEVEILKNKNQRENYDSLNSWWRRARTNLSAFFLEGRWEEGLSGSAADQQVLANQRAFRDKYRQGNPVLDQIRGEAQDYRQTISTLRGMGLSPRQVRDPQTGAMSAGSGYGLLAKQRAAYSQFSDGEIIAAFQGVSGSGERRAAYGLQGLAMHGQAAGVHGLTSSLGIMSKFGARGASLFGQEALRLASGGNLDASTAGLLAQTVAQQAQKLGIATDGPGFQGSGLLRSLSIGTQGPGGLLIAEQNIRGMQATEAMVRGETSPYQKARNWGLASDVAGTGANSALVSHMASKMTMGQLEDAASGRGIDPVFASMGGTAKMAADYLKRVRGTMFEGTTAEILGGKNTLSGRALQAFQDSGMGMAEFLQKGRKQYGLSEKDAIAGLSAAAATANDVDSATALGMIRTASGGVGAARGSGRAGAGGSNETDLAAAHLKLLADNAQLASGGLKDFFTNLQNVAAYLQFVATMGQQNMTPMSPSEAAAIQDFAINSKEQVTADSLMKKLQSMRRGPEESEVIRNRIAQEQSLRQPRMP